jgi:hypothetical protein
VSGRQNDAQAPPSPPSHRKISRISISLAATAKADASHPPLLAIVGVRPQQLKKLQDYVFVVKVYRERPPLFVSSFNAPSGQKGRFISQLAGAIFCALTILRPIL